MQTLSPYCKKQFKDSAFCYHLSWSNNAFSYFAKYYKTKFSHIDSHIQHWCKLPIQWSCLLHFSSKSYMETAHTVHYRYKSNITIPYIHVWIIAEWHWPILYLTIIFYILDNHLAQLWIQYTILNNIIWQMKFTIWKKYFILSKFFQIIHFFPITPNCTVPIFQRRMW